VADSDSLVVAHGVHYSAGDHAILNGVHLELLRGESIALMGRSGAGKTTFLSLCMGLMKPSIGELTVAGVDMSKASASRVARMRRESVGMVFQHGELLPELTPMENVAVAGLLAGKSTRIARTRAAELLESLGIPSRDEPTATLSGGERQRTAFARALMNEPDLLLADEPTGSLDDSTKDSVAQTLFSLPRTHGCALLLVSHDASLCTLADRLLTMRDGKVEMANDE
jgi:lipoprotein-releasing system ATP-binding protein